MSLWSTPLFYSLSPSKAHWQPSTNSSFLSLRGDHSACSYSHSQKRMYSGSPEQEQRIMEDNYFVRQYPEAPEKIEMSFNLSTYQSHMKQKGELVCGMAMLLYLRAPAHLSCILCASCRTSCCPFSYVNGLHLQLDLTCSCLLLWLVRV